VLFSVFFAVFFVALLSPPEIFLPTTLPPVTRKRRCCNILDESTPAQELSNSEFSVCFFDFLPLNLLLVRGHQAEIIIAK